MFNIEIIPTRSNPQVAITYPNKKTYFYTVTYGLMEDVGYRVEQINRMSIPEGGKRKLLSKVVEEVKEKAISIWKPEQKDEE